MPTSGFMQVSGPTEEVKRLAARLKGAERDMRRELPKALAGGAKIVRDAAQEKAATMPLPKSGGFDRAYRRSIRTAVVTKVRGVSRSPKVEVGFVGKSAATRKAKDVAYRLNSTGRIRHPVFGNRKAWTDTQTTDEGWFTKTAEEKSDEALTEMSKRLDRLAQYLAGYRTLP